MVSLIKMAEYKDYTDEEYDAMDEYYTKNTVMPVNGKPGVFARQKKPVHMLMIDELSADYLTTKALAEHTTPAAIINKLVRAQIAASL
jgi:hypothetical protein